MPFEAFVSLVNNVPGVSYYIVALLFSKSPWSTKIFSFLYIQLCYTFVLIFLRLFLSPSVCSVMLISFLFLRSTSNFPPPRHLSVVYVHILSIFLSLQCLLLCSATFPLSSSLFFFYVPVTYVTMFPNLMCLFSLVNFFIVATHVCSGVILMYCPFKMRQTMTSFIMKFVAVIPALLVFFFSSLFFTWSGFLF